MHGGCAATVQQGQVNQAPAGGFAFAFWVLFTLLRLERMRV